jgi:hypothetical protein
LDQLKYFREQESWERQRDLKKYWDFFSQLGACFNFEHEDGTFPAFRSSKINTLLLRVLTTSQAEVKLSSKLIAVFLMVESHPQIS